MVVLKALHVQPVGPALLVKVHKHLQQNRENEERQATQTGNPIAMGFMTAALSSCEMSRGYLPIHLQLFRSLPSLCLVRTPHLLLQLVLPVVNDDGVVVSVETVN